MKALCHPLRIQILTILNDRVASPSELSKLLPEGLSQVSYHVQVLKDFDVIEMIRTEPRRGAVEHYYKATSEVFLPAWQMEMMPKSAQRAAFSGVLAELEQDMRASLETGTFDKRSDWVVARDPRIFDDQGRKDLEFAAGVFLKKCKEIGRESVDRLAKSKGEPVSTTVAVLAFGSARDKTPKPERKPKSGRKPKPGK